MALLLFAFYSALKIGLFVDEPYHHKLGGLRYLYMVTLGKSPYIWENTQWYPGLYDTISFVITDLLLISNPLIMLIPPYNKPIVKYLLA